MSGRLRVYIMKLHISIFFIAITLTTIIVANAVSIVVNIPDQGSVIGSIDQTSWTKQQFYSFRGIPYAESPSGKMRFKSPKSRAPWSETFDAQRFGKRCPVITTISKLNSTQLKEDLEDCLNINVYTKSLNSKQPIMFYIHGGGFYNGSAIDHPPHYLLEKDVVLVVPQYRIGALGWLTTLTDEMPGNVPVLDLLLALRWVQNYIHVFGGDPERVTIFGQSAGSAMSGALLLSPKTSEQYFKKSIVQSGSIIASWAINRTPIEQVERTCMALGCGECEEKLKQYDCLENVHVLDLLKVTTDESFVPVIGDVHGVLPAEPKLLLDNLNRTVPLMIGFTKHDGSYLLTSFYDHIMTDYGSISKITVRQFASTLIGSGRDYTDLTENMLIRWLFNEEILNTNDHQAAWPAYIDIANIISLKSPIIAYANSLQRRGATPVYFFSFDYVGEHTRFGFEHGNSQYPFEGGVHHSNDNIYLFATHALNAKDTKFAKKMVDLWYSFAANGEPKVNDQPDIVIKPMETESGPYFHINAETTLGKNILLELTATVDDSENYKIVRQWVNI